MGINSFRSILRPYGRVFLTRSSGSGAGAPDDENSEDVPAEADKQSENGEKVRTVPICFFWKTPICLYASRILAKNLRQSWRL